jgi:large subunit ribosomal protein L4
MIDSEVNADFKRASQNLANFRYYAADGINVYDLLKYDFAIVTPTALDKIYARCGLEKAHV